MKKVVFALLAVSVFGISSSLGQDTDEKKNKGKLYVLAGVQHINVDNINTVLKSHDLPQVNKFHSYYGYGGSWQTDNWILGGEGYHMNTGEDYDQASDDNTKETQLSTIGGIGYFYLGYSVINKEGFYLTPRIGVGGGGMNIQINEYTETSLDSLLSSNSSINLTTGGAILHSGLKFGFVLGKHWDFNLDAGYNYGFATKWNVPYGELTESVEDAIGGAFAQVTIGYTF